MGPLRPIGLELRHLRLILALVETGRMSVAAELLHVSQPALSHQLRTIETRLGLPLFRRTSSGLIATDRSLALAHCARRVLLELVDAEASLRVQPSVDRAYLRVATEAFTYYDWLPPVLRRFEQLHPRVEIEVRLQCFDQPLEHLRKGAIDLAFAVTGPFDSDLDSWYLTDAELLLAGCPALLDALPEPFVSPEDLRGLRLIVHRPHDWDAFAGSFFRANGLDDVGVLVVQPTAALMAMLRAGAGIALLPRWITRDFDTNSDLVTRRLGEPGVRQRWFAVARRTTLRPCYIDAFVRCMTVPRPRPADCS